MKQLFLTALTAATLTAATLTAATLTAAALTSPAYAGLVVTSQNCVLNQGVCVVLGGTGSGATSITGNPAPTPPVPIQDPFDD